MAYICCIIKNKKPNNMKKLVQKIDEWIAKEQKVIDEKNAMSICDIDFLDLAKAKCSKKTIKRLSMIKKDLLKSNSDRCPIELHYNVSRDCIKDLDNDLLWFVKGIGEYFNESHIKVTLYCGELLAMKYALPEKAIIKEKKAVAAAH